MWIETAVGGDDAVAVEVIVGGRIASVVATIGKDLLTRQRTLVAQRLVDEVPDEATLILGMLAYELPILLESTHRITHGVGILALDEGTGIVALGILVAITIVVVHGAEDVGLAVLACLLVLHGARRVDRFDPVIDVLEVGTITSLVAHAPDDDAGMVAQGEHIALIAL